MKIPNLIGYRLRLSGVFPEEAAKVLDKESLTGYSPVVALFRCKDGTLGRKDASDAVGAEDLNLWPTVRRHLERIGRSILQGKMSAQPALHRGRLPCDLCSWLAVCRFDRVWDSYRLLRTLSKKEVLEALRDSPRA
ncbi:MAG: hypothetical protein RMJ82_14985 [Gemmatales bacterium]|nr:hypothetical protein [Gemmatales bacterium]